MSSIHYKLPLDEEIDSDIIEWINTLPRMKKGEMIRHAIRYYMAVLEEGETIKFPNASVRMVERVVQIDTTPNPEPEVKKEEKRKPNFSRGGITGRTSD